MKYIFFLVTLLFISFDVKGQYAEVSQVWHWCSGTGGAIQIELLEGEPEDYYYLWSHDGSRDLYIDDLLPGSYVFYIENINGCSQTINVEIIKVGGCKPPSVTLDAQWDPIRCGFDIEITWYMTDGESPAPILFPNGAEYVAVNWDIQNLSGSSVFIEMPQDQDQIEACLEYRIPTIIGGENCCSGYDCITLVRPDAQSVCGFSEPCRAVINEVFSKKGDSFVELLVVGDKKDCPSFCDIRNIILDDNNGQVINDLKPLDNFLSSNIDNGYLSLKDVPNWSSVPIGSMIVLYENAKSKDHINDPTDTDKDNVYSVWAGDDNYIQGFAHTKKPGLNHYDYDGFPAVSKWDFIKVDKGYDGLQVRSSPSTKGHSLSFGQSELQNVKSPGSTPLFYSLGTSGNLSAALVGDNYNSSSDYQVNVVSSKLETPRKPNSQANSDFINDLLNCGKSLVKKAQLKKEVSQLSYEVTPNPTNGNSIVSINTLYSGSCTVLIRSVSGKKILAREVKISSGENRWQLPKIFSSQAAGIYLIDVIVDGKSIGAKKIILTQ